MRCDQCKYWRPEGHMGTCKRYPKPWTKGGSDWCGEYVAIEVLTLPVVQMSEPKRKPGRPAKGDKDGE